MSLPFCLNKVLDFIGWMKARDLKSRTISTYLSGVRMYHISMGHNEPSLRQPMVKLILKGQSNMERVQEILRRKSGCFGLWLPWPGLGLLGSMSW